MTTLQIVFWGLVIGWVIASQLVHIACEYHGRDGLGLAVSKDESEHWLGRFITNAAYYFIVAWPARLAMVFTDDERTLLWVSKAGLLLFLYTICMGVISYI